MTPTLRMAAVLGMLAVVSSTGSCASASTPLNTSPSTAVASEAADLRTHLDLLLGEQIMIVAKETCAAVNHSDDYSTYTDLLFTNQLDLSLVVNQAFGISSAQDFAQVWSIEDNDLVDYGIGVVTHNDRKSNDALSGLNGNFAPKFATFANDVFGLSSDETAPLIGRQVSALKALIDDAAAQKYASFYTDLEAAYSQSERLGDALAARIAQKFPDRYPGDPMLPSVDRRVRLNALLQEHAYLATMATNAVIGSRDTDTAAAAAALDSNGTAISRSLSDLYGAAAAGSFDKAWSARDAAIIAYAQKGDSDSRRALAATATAVALAARVPAAPVSSELTALIKVIDDQRAQASDRIAGDDRAAATSMQPVADAIVPGPTI